MLGSFWNVKRFMFVIRTILQSTLQCAIGHLQAMVPIDRPALVAPLAGPAGCSGKKKKR